ncbi:MAG: CRISPR-associated protein Csx16 [Candidatus Paceibacterota bacterium]|jgi:putative CRISPR-associated protein (TIGR02620 family)
MNKIDLIVTRHPGLVDYLRELGMVGDGVEIIDHATPEAVTGRHVCGVLPHSLSCLCATFTEVPLRLTPELRGKELDLDTLREIADEPVTYRIEKI